MSKKSGYLNRTLEFHKIYEEEIIPILKSYKQQNEKADKKNRYLKSLGNAVSSLGCMAKEYSLKMLLTL